MNLRRHRKKFKLLGIIALLVILYFAFIHTRAMRTYLVFQEIKNLNAVVATKNKEEIISYLRSYIADDAKITLNVAFGVIGMSDSNVISTEHFTKDDFLRFIDLTLYPLGNFGMSMQLTGLSFSTGFTAADISTRSHEWAKDMNAYGASQSGNYASTTHCDGKVSFPREEGKTVARLQEATCEVRIEMGEEDNGKSLNDLIKQSEAPAQAATPAQPTAPAANP